MNDRFNLLPSPDDFAQFVTWAGLEDALSGIKKDWENMQQPPSERVVIEMSSQTEAVSISSKLSYGITWAETRHIHVASLKYFLISVIPISSQFLF